jgi:serine/threonine protein kinase
MKIPESVPWVPTGETLGSGGQANVYLVTRRGSPGSRKYALKVLKHSNSPQARARFVQEITAVKSLDSPLIAKIIDHSEADDSFQYYTMEYYEGAQSLEEIIFSDSNPFYADVMKCLSLFEQLVLAIRTCENAKPKIIHRDITPKNILLLVDGSIRLIDFGICLIQDGQRVTLTDEDVGTRNYTAPECEAGNDSEIGVHSDLYSAGKVLWSCITSQRAFAREKPVFDNKSMLALFPRTPETFHLNMIFEKTIRALPSNRYNQTAPLMNLIGEAKRLVKHGYPPLENVAKTCPSCGRAAVTAFSGGIQFFANPSPLGFEYFTCEICGFVFIRHMQTLTERFRLLRDLD